MLHTCISLTLGLACEAIPGLFAVHLAAHPTPVAAHPGAGVVTLPGSGRDAGAAARYTGPPLCPLPPTTVHCKHKKMYTHFMDTLVCCLK